MSYKLNDYHYFYLIYGNKNLIEKNIKYKIQNTKYKIQNNKYKNRKYNGFLVIAVTWLS